MFSVMLCAASLAHIQSVDGSADQEAVENRFAADISTEVISHDSLCSCTSF